MMAKDGEKGPSYRSRGEGKKEGGHKRNRYKKSSAKETKIDESRRRKKR